MTTMTLDLPEADNKIATRRTVTTVLCQVRYEQQASVAAGVTALKFQEKLGGPDGLYPKVEEAEGANRIVMGIGQGRPVTDTTRINGWTLSSADDAWSLALLPGQMGLQTDSYDGWDNFEQRFTVALNALAEVIGPSFEQRLGLRFVDVFGVADVDSPTGWEPYITPPFLGALVAPVVGPQIQVTFQQALIDVGDGAVCNLRTGPMGAAPDGNVGFVVDCDLYREASRVFDPAVILSAVDTFREQADRLLQAVAMPALLEKMVK
jgi:uncharacterized protein (TIGR04255 family)